MLGDSSKSWGVPRLHPLHNSCIPIWAEPLCFLNTPLPSSVHFTGEVLPEHFTGDAVKALVSVTPAALNSAAGAIPYQQKQSLLGRKGKRGTNELKTEQRPRCHGMSPKVSTSFGVIHHFYSWRETVVLKLRWRGMLEPITHCLQFNSFIQEGVRRLKLGIRAGQGTERNPFQALLTRSAPQANSQEPTPFSNQGCNSCTQILLNTGLSTPPKISNSWECEKHQARPQKQKALSTRITFWVSQEHMQEFTFHIHQILHFLPYLQ